MGDGIVDSGGKKVYILTNFSAYLKSYSPIIIVKGQLQMFKRAGYEPVLITSKGWEVPEDSIFNQVRTERLSPVTYQDPPVVNEEFEHDVETLYQELKAIIPARSVVITHDLIFLPDYTKHHLAARKLAEDEPSIRWIHWVHSATNPQILIQEREMYGPKYKELLNSKFPNSIIAYPNAYDIPRVARHFSFEEDEIVEVPHPTDPVEGMSRVVRRLYDEKRLGDVDVLMVYPLRLDRGKNAEMNVRIIAGCLEVGLSAHLVFCDFHSTGGDKVQYRQELKELAEQLDAGDAVTFLSEFDDASQLESDHQVVLDLFTLSNVFCLPSKSETYSLVAQEAMLKGNLCILNHDFAPFRQIYGRNALYRPFSANIGMDGYDGQIDTTYADIDEYFRQIGVNLKYWLEQDRVLRAKTWVRTVRNPDYVFREFIQPLINAEEGTNAEV